MNKYHASSDRAIVGAQAEKFALSYLQEYVDPEAKLINQNCKGPDKGDILCKGKIVDVKTQLNPAYTNFCIKLRKDFTPDVFMCVDNHGNNQFSFTRFATPEQVRQRGRNMGAYYLI